MQIGLGLHGVSFVANQSTEAVRNNRRVSSLEEGGKNGREAGSRRRGVGKEAKSIQTSTNTIPQKRSIGMTFD
jgi:hypothetical protein